VRILTIGRKGTDVVLDETNQQISRLHAELTITDSGNYYLVDCGSSNGTSIKRENTWKPIKQEFVSKDDQVRFGGHYAITIRELLRKL
jgi:pSer/pThr/pTyr-binding forkhead associated (FHA) protein